MFVYVCNYVCECMYVSMYVYVCTHACVMDQGISRIGSRSNGLSDRCYIEGVMVLQSIDQDAIERATDDER